MLQGMETMLMNGEFDVGTTTRNFDQNFKTAMSAGALDKEPRTALPPPPPPPLLPASRSRPLEPSESIEELSKELKSLCDIQGQMMDCIEEQSMSLAQSSRNTSATSFSRGGGAVKGGKKYAKKGGGVGIGMLLSAAVPAPKMREKREFKRVMKEDSKPTASSYLAKDEEKESEGGAWGGDDSSADDEDYDAEESSAGERLRRASSDGYDPSDDGVIASDIDVRCFSCQLTVSIECITYHDNRLERNNNSFGDHLIPRR